MVIKAKNQQAYDDACNTACSLPMGYPLIDVDPDCCGTLDADQYEIEGEDK